MLVRTDDEVYRVDAVWLGPPRATFPWRARYVSYGVGLLVMMLIMMVQRRLGIGLDFFSVAWALVGTVALTRLLGKKIDYERPLGQVLGQFWAEVTGPRPGRKPARGSVRAGHVRVQASRNRPGAPGRGERSRPWSGSDRGAPTVRPGPRVAGPVDAATNGPLGERVPTKGPFVSTPRGGATAPAPDPATTNGPFVGNGGMVVDGTPGDGEAREAPRRVVPPLPEPGSAPRRSRFRRARGGARRVRRGVTDPARTRRPDPWHGSGHRGRS
ncbi:hypothetical protein ACFO4M_16795 [Pseudonocardia nematodicida]|uniref:hypothetical protein n=1 Tax=Pseudonocardia nematodicida TaxID=1206997 RepID=UPI00360DD9F8